MLGHWRPLFLRFARGGRWSRPAAASSSASRRSSASPAPPSGSSCSCARYASVASMVAGLLAAAARACVFGEPWPVVAFGALAAVGRRRPPPGEHPAAALRDREPVRPAPSQARGGGRLTLYFCSNGLRSSRGASPSRDPDARAGRALGCARARVELLRHPGRAGARAGGPRRAAGAHRVRAPGGLGRPLHELRRRDRDERRGDRQLVARAGPDPGAAVRPVHVPVRAAARPGEHPARSRTATRSSIRRRRSSRSRARPSPIELLGSQDDVVVYYDGPASNPNLCGLGGGGLAVVFLDSCPGIDTARVAAHELGHALGAVPSSAPHVCPDSAHTCDNPNDLMYPYVDGPLSSAILDPGTTTGTATRARGSTSRTHPS